MFIRRKDYEMILAEKENLTKELKKYYALGSTPAEINKKVEDLEWEIMGNKLEIRRLKEKLNATPKETPKKTSKETPKKPRKAKAKNETKQS